MRPAPAGADPGRSPDRRASVLQPGGSGCLLYTSWCAVFVWWVFREAGAPELYYGGGETAYCPTLMSFHKKQAVTEMCIRDSRYCVCRLSFRRKAAQRVLR